MSSEANVPPCQGVGIFCFDRIIAIFAISWLESTFLKCLVHGHPMLVAPLVVALPHRRQKISTDCVSAQSFCAVLSLLSSCDVRQATNWAMLGLSAKNSIRLDRQHQAEHLTLRHRAKKANCKALGARTTLRRDTYLTLSRRCFGTKTTRLKARPLSRSPR